MYLFLDLRLDYLFYVEHDKRYFVLIVEFLS